MVANDARTHRWGQRYVFYLFFTYFASVNTATRAYSMFLNRFLCFFIANACHLSSHHQLCRAHNLQPTSTCQQPDRCQNASLGPTVCFYIFRFLFADTTNPQNHHQRCRAHNLQPTSIMSTAQSMRSGIVWAYVMFLNSFFLILSSPALPSLTPKTITNAPHTSIYHVRNLATQALHTGTSNGAREHERDRMRVV